MQQKPLSVIHILLNGMYQPMQPSPPSTKQQVTVSLPTPLIERLRNEAPGQVCPDIAPQPGVQKLARPPPGIRRTDTIRSTVHGLATHRTESPPQYHSHRPSRIAVNRPRLRVPRSLPFMSVSHVLGMANPRSQGPTCCTWRENSCWCIRLV